MFPYAHLWGKCIFFFNSLYPYSVQHSSGKHCISGALSNALGDAFSTWNCFWRVKIKLVSLISKLFSAQSEQVNIPRPKSDHSLFRPQIRQEPPVTCAMKPSLRNQAEKDLRSLILLIPLLLPPCDIFSRHPKPDTSQACALLFAKGLFSSKSSVPLSFDTPAGTWRSATLP